MPGITNSELCLAHRVARLREKDARPGQDAF